jgi:hypothetical protein
MEPKNILESLLKENIEMINEITEITKGDYQTGYIQALLNVQSSLEHRLNPSMQQPRTFTCLSKSIYKLVNINVNIT